MLQLKPNSNPNRDHDKIQENTREYKYDDDSREEIIEIRGYAALASGLANS